MSFKEEINSGKSSNNSGKSSNNSGKTSNNSDKTQICLLVDTEDLYVIDTYLCNHHFKTGEKLSRSDAMTNYTLEQIKLIKEKQTPKGV